MQAIKIEKYNNVYVARDDLIAGGTKFRGLIHWLPTLKKTHFFYAGTVFGSGAWALAECCAELGFDCTILISKSKYIPVWINDIQKLNAKFEWCEPSPVADLHQTCIARAHEYNGYAIPLGFDHIDFQNHLASELKKIELPSNEIWLPCVGGVLAQTARKAWQNADINVVTSSKFFKDLGTVTTHESPYKYHQPAKNMPPYPSCAFSDAKTWEFALHSASNDAVIWNTSK